MHASSRISFSSALDESRSRRLLRRHRIHLPHPARKSSQPFTQPATPLEISPDSQVVPAVVPTVPPETVTLPAEPD